MWGIIVGIIALIIIVIVAIVIFSSVTGKSKLVVLPPKVEVPVVVAPPRLPPISTPPSVIAPIIVARPNIPDGVAILQEQPTVEEPPPLPTQQGCSTSDDCPPNSICLGGTCVSIA